MFLLAALSFPAFSQQMKFIQAGEIFELREIGGILEQEKDHVKVLAVMPKDRRAKAYREVDVQEGDLILFFNGNRVEGIKDLEQIYAALAIGDTIQIGLQRKEDRLIVALTKADPKSLPVPQMRKVMVSPDGKMTTEQTTGGETHRVVKTLDPNASEITAVMGLGVVVGNVGGAVKVLDKLPVPAQGLAGVDLQEGDVLQTLNHYKIASAPQFNEAFEKIAVGAKVDLQYLRKEKTMTASFHKPEAQGQMMIRTRPE
jgi:S1-C subfamily serine protease